MARRPGEAGTIWASGRGRSLLIAGLILFLIVDVVLVVTAVRATSTEKPGRLGPIPTFSSTPAPDPTSTPTSSGPGASGSPAPSSTPASATDGQGRAALLSAVSATTAWRTQPGTCGSTPTTVERSTDAGATWKKIDLGDSAVDDAVYLNAGSTLTSVAGGTGNTCAVAYVSTFTGGDFWAPYPGNLAQATYIDPGDSRLHLPSGTEKAPCSDPLRIATTSALTAVQCADGLSVRVGSGQWVEKSVPGLVAVAPGRSGILLAVGGASGCSGVAIQSMSAAGGSGAGGSSIGDPVAVGCATALDATGLSASTAALSTAGGDLWLWAGSKVLVSSDGGATW